MTVYVDVLFALNAMLNYLLLLGSARLGGGRIRRARLLAAGCFGGVYAAAAQYPQLQVLQTAPMQALIPVVMVLLAFGSEKRTIRLGGLFLALAFCFGGLVLLCVHLLGSGLMIIGGGAYYPVSVSGLLMLAGLAYLAAHFVFSRIAEHGGGEITDWTLQLGAHTAGIRALRDTGNTLRDPITNERVLVTDVQTAQALLPDAALTAEQLQRPDVLLPQLSRLYPKLRFRLLPYRAVGTQAGILLAVRCSALDASGRERQILTAFSPTPISDGGNYNALTGGCL